MLAKTDANGRTPEFRPRQLHDLTLAPSKTDARPLFIWSADKPRNDPNANKTYEFPKLMWHGETGEEITIPRSKDSLTLQAQRVKEGYVFVDPRSGVEESPLDRARRELESLSPEDRQFVLEAQHKSRMAKIETQIAALPQDELAALLAESVSKAKGKKSA